MTASEQIKLRVAIASGSERQRNNLKAILEKSGLQVVIDRAPNEQFLILIDSGQADVLLVDLDEEIEEELGFVELLLERSTLPILFNDSASTRMDAASCNSEWGRALARKLRSLVNKTNSGAPASDTLDKTACMGNTSPPSQEASSTPAALAHSVNPTPVKKSMAALLRNTPAAKAPVVPKQKVARALSQTVKSPDMGQQVWVLGASIGGPQAVKAFLSEISADLPVTFILAQHIGAGFAELLADQLNNISPFQVTIAHSGHKLSHHEVILAPVDEQLVINAHGQLELLPLSLDNGLYRPSIDAVMSEVARSYGAEAGAIIFSGMGDDGVKGCHVMAQYGGTVWAQDAGSCLISSMPDNARKAGMVSFSGSPEMLARQLSVHLQIAPGKKGKYMLSKEERL